LASAERAGCRSVALQWCRHASDHAKTYNGKPWKYVLMPHDAVAENMTIERLAERFS
jgi:type III restriction enzyme